MAKRGRASAEPADSDPDFSAGDGAGARPVSKRAKAARDDHAHAAAAGGAAAASAPSALPAIDQVGPLTMLPGAAAGARAKKNKEALHWCLECCEQVVQFQFRRDNTKKESNAHRHRCAGGFGGKAAARRGEATPCSHCKLDEEWLVDALAVKFDAFLEARPTLRELWDAVRTGTETAVRDKVKKDLRGGGTKVAEAVAILEKRMKQLASSTALQGSHNPNPDAEGVQPDAVEDLAHAPPAAAGAAAPPSEADGERGPAGPAPAPRDAGFPRALCAKAAGNARAALPAAGKRSNVSAHVVDEPVARFDVVGEIEAKLHGDDAAAVHSVLHLSGSAGVGKSSFGLWLAQRRSRREHTWQPRPVRRDEDWMANAQPPSCALPEEAEFRPPADALGPFFVSMRGVETPGAASMHLLHLLSLGYVPAAAATDVVVPEADAAELLHAALCAELPDVEGAPVSHSSCLFVLDDCDELLAPATAAATWAWVLRLAGVAPGVRVVMLSRTPSLPPLGAVAKAAHVPLLPLLPEGVHKWFQKAEAAMPEVRSGLIQPLSAEDAKQLAHACGGFPGVIEPLIRSFRKGLRRTEVAQLLQALACDVEGSAAAKLAHFGVPPALLQLPPEVKHLEADVAALAALEPLLREFSSGDACLALGCATQDDADAVLLQLAQHDVVRWREAQGAEADAPLQSRRIFRMCGLRVALARGSAPWFAAKARVQAAPEAAAAGPSVSDFVPAPSPSRGHLPAMHPYGTMHPLSPRPLSQMGEDFNLIDDCLAHDYLRDAALSAPPARQPALLGADDLAAVLPAAPPPPRAQQRGSGRRGPAPPRSPSVVSFREGSCGDLGSLGAGPPSFTAGPSGSGGTAAKARRRGPKANKAGAPSGRETRAAAKSRGR